MNVSFKNVKFNFKNVIESIELNVDNWINWIIKTGVDWGKWGRGTTGTKESRIVKENG